MNPKGIVMGPLHLWYERLGLGEYSVSLTDETVKEINSINVNEDADADQLRQRLLKNFYDAGISVLVARFVVAEATLNTSKSGDRMFWNMIEVRDHVFSAILHWLCNHSVSLNDETAREIDSINVNNVDFDHEAGRLWNELRDLGTLCSKKSIPANKK